MSKDQDYSAGIGCGALIGIFAVPAAALLALPVSLIRGYVLGIMWVWFALPLGAPEISYGHSVGLVLLVGFLRAPVKPDAKPEKQPEPLEFLKSIGQAMLHQWLLVPAITLLLGWVVHHWLM